MHLRNSIAYLCACACYPLYFMLLCLLMHVHTFLSFFFVVGNSLRRTAGVRTRVFLNSFLSFCWRHALHSFSFMNPLSSSHSLRAVLEELTCHPHEHCLHLCLFLWSSFLTSFRMANLLVRCFRCFHFGLRARSLLPCWRWPADVVTGD